MNPNDTPSWPSLLDQLAWAAAAIEAGGAPPVDLWSRMIAVENAAFGMSGSARAYVREENERQGKEEEPQPLLTAPDVDLTKETEESEQWKAAANGILRLRKRPVPFSIDGPHDLIIEHPDGSEAVLSSHPSRLEALDAGARRWLQEGQGAEKVIQQAADELRPPRAAKFSS